MEIIYILFLLVGLAFLLRNAKFRSFFLKILFWCLGYLKSSYSDDHLKNVTKGYIAKQPLMNKSEYKLYQQLENWRKIKQDSYLRLFSQVSMGEVLRTDNDEVRRSFNSKRLDFVFINGLGYPLIAVEYQGQGHFGNDPKKKASILKRDQVKKIALDRAGVPLVEIFPTDKEDEILAKLNSVYNSLR